MLKVDIRQFDIHFTHKCNLRCEQCTHFSNFNLNESISVEELIENYESWYKKINPKDVVISGGEPLLHPNFIEMLELTKDYWPNSRIIIYTNGLLLEKKSEILKFLKHDSIFLVVSNHSTKNSKKYDEKWKLVVELIIRWVKEYNLTNIEIDGYNENNLPAQFEYDLVGNQHYKLTSLSHPLWLKFYKGYGKEIEPFDDNDVENSWNNCVVNQDCFQLLDKHFYKCAPLAYLPKLNKKIGLSEKWNYYLSYEPLSPESSYEEIKEFFNRQAESYCNMCPSKPHSFTPENDPMKAVIVKV